MTLGESLTEGIFNLPGGLFHHGKRLRQVRLHPPTGRLEELLGNISEPRSVASAVTELLTHCIDQIGTITNVTSEVVRDLLIGDRDYLVLKLRQITLGSKVEATLVCPNPECGEKIDIDFDLRDVPIERGQTSSQFFEITLPKQDKVQDDAETEYYTVVFRLPKGGDQEDLAWLAVNDESRAADELLALCVQQIQGIADIDNSQAQKLLLSARREIEGKMEELAPQIDLELELKCPECEREFLFPFNISRFFLDEIQVNLDQLYQEVHFLAFYYKWSEADILSMTRKKRRKYLELLSEHIERSRGQRVPAY